MSNHDREQQLKNASLRPVDRLALMAATEYVDRHLCEPVSLGSLCEVAAMSPSKLTGLFKLVYGRTPIEFVRECRLEHGRERLIHTDMSLRELSTYLGFAHQSSFSEAFKHLFGMSPLAYRKEYTGTTRDTTF